MDDYRLSSQFEFKELTVTWKGSMGSFPSRRTESPEIVLLHLDVW
jgi:hypothetical protein